MSLNSPAEILQKTCRWNCAEKVTNFSCRNPADFLQAKFAKKVTHVPAGILYRILQAKSAGFLRRSHPVSFCEFPEIPFSIGELPFLAHQPALVELTNRKPIEDKH